MNEEQMRAEFEVWYKGKYWSRLSDRAVSIAFRTKSNGEYDSYRIRDAWEIWRAALASQAKSVPDGYVLVPNEPTDEMVEAAARHYESGDYTGIRSTYKVMLAASPQPPTDDRVRELEKDAARYHWLKDNYHGLAHYRSGVIPGVDLGQDIDKQIAAMKGAKQ